MTSLPLQPPDSQAITPALEALQQENQWVNWIYIPSKEEGKKPTKLLFNPQANAAASSTDPATWNSYEVVKDAYNASQMNGRKLQGIGFVFNKKHVGVDLDQCIDEDGNIDEWAMDIIKRFDSYTEYSPSGTGVHILMNGWTPGFQGTKKELKGKRHHRAAIEIYSYGRYFTITGKHLPGTPDSLKYRVQEATDLYNELKEKPERVKKEQPQQQVQGGFNGTDEELIERAMKSTNGAKFKALWNGDYDAGSQSEADAALCTMLAFWTGRDAERMDRLFRESGLMRDKWDSKRGSSSYGERTIEHSIDLCDEVYTPQVKGEQQKPKAKTPTTTTKIKQGRMLTDVQAQEVHWLWKGRIPLGKITILDGEPDKGKSLITLDIIARITKGRAMPDKTPGVEGGAVIIAVEDDVATTIVPRLEAAGADKSKVMDLSYVSHLNTETGEIEEYPFSMPGNLDVLRDAIEEVNAKIVVIDPFMAILDHGLKSKDDQDIRKALTPLAKLADETGAAIVIVRHFNKGGSDNPLMRGAGSMGIIGAARSGLFVAQDPESEDRRVLGVSKHNLSKEVDNLCYHIVENEHHQPRVEWDGVSAYSSHSLLGAAKPSEHRMQIIKLLREAERPLTPQEIAHAVGIDNENTAASLLSRMLKRDEIKSPSRGLYTVSKPQINNNNCDDIEGSIERGARSARNASFERTARSASFTNEHDAVEHTAVENVITGDAANPAVNNENLAQIANLALLAPKNTDGNPAVLNHCAPIILEDDEDQHPF